MTNEDKIKEAALQYAIKHSKAPDKETPDWIITDFKAGVKWHSELQTNKDELFNFFSNEHNLILTDTELNDIINAVKNFKYD